MKYSGFIFGKIETTVLEALVGGTVNPSLQNVVSVLDQDVF